jgi:hypothetical protein
MTGAQARRFIKSIRDDPEATRLRGEIEQHNRQSGAAVEAGDHDAAQKYMNLEAKARTQLRDIENEQRQRIRQDILYVETPAKFSHRFITNFKARRKAGYQEGLEEFAKLVGTGTLDGKSVGVRGGGQGRSFYSLKNEIAMGTHAGVKTTIHELGHWLEGVDPDIHRKALEFYDRRTAGEQLEWLGPGYGRDEMTRKDRFLSAYMGKEYMNRRTRERYASEIISMGIEYLWGDPVDFAQRDPEYFDFIYDLLRGN